MKLLILLSISLLFLSNCASNGTTAANYKDSLVLELNEPITVPAGSSFAYVKAPGEVVRRKEIGTYELYCKFLVPRPKNSGETVIYPDKFQIHGIHQRSAQVMHELFAEYQLAFNGSFRRNGNHNSQRDLELFFAISSVNQPQVKSLSCIRFSDPVFYNMPTLKEVRALFGNLAQFTPA